MQSEVSKFVVISDDNVRSNLQDKLFPQAAWLSVPAGEDSKSLECVSSLWSQMLALGLDRGSAVVAVGGGVVGDLAGFVASTYMRGVPFYSVPTSLLAMVDASVGGKVGIDLPEGKNLVGQFYPAKRVVVDPELLATLPEAEWSAGMAEVIKHGILRGQTLWEDLLSFRLSDREDAQRLENLVQEAVQLKVGVVSEDPYERTGLRATLNLGHSYGHAIEWCSDFELNHGQAVSLGLLCGLRLAGLMGRLQSDFESQLMSLLKRWNLPLLLPNPQDPRWGWQNIALALDRDKKTKNGEWCFILPREVGSVETIYGPPKDLVRAAYQSLFPSGVTV